MKLLLSLLIFVTCSCALQPTKSSEKSQRIFKFANKELPGPMKSILPDQASVIIDVRTPFEYSLAHIPNSVNVQWDEFSEQGGNYKGKLQTDLFSITTRLARLGVDPEAKVLVVGQGLMGGGEEGRMAWMLTYLGVKQVSAIALSSLKARMINTTQEQNKAAPIWKPKVFESLMCTPKEFLYVVNHNGVVNPISYDSAPTRLYKIIDVRSDAEYLGRPNLENNLATPDVGAINIEWKEFFTKQGLPKKDLKKQLSEIGIKPENRILVIDSGGVRSGAATMALLQLGFSNVANCAGGWKEILDTHN
jgi:thiosulfate/3-mercaptopyruvate sulfurtransferase